MAFGQCKEKKQAEAENKSKYKNWIRLKNKLMNPLK